MIPTNHHLPLEAFHDETSGVANVDAALRQQNQPPWWPEDCLIIAFLWGLLIGLTLATACLVIP